MNELHDYIKHVEKMMNAEDYESRRREWVANRANELFSDALAESMLPVRIASILRKGFKRTKTYNACRDALERLQDRGGNFLVARGALGTGKTVALSMLMLELAASEQSPLTSCRFIAATALCETSNFDQVRELEHIGTRAGALLLDDIGQEGRNHQRIEMLLSQRYDEESMTFITTNAPIAKLKKIYGSRIIQRLAERGIRAECNDVIRPGVKG